MHRTEGTNHNSNLFTDGPPGTRIEENWLNAVQEEIAYLIEEAGLTLKTASTETQQQLKQAIDLLYSPMSGSKISRAQFTYNGGAVAFTVKAGNGSYRVKDKTARWVSELTTSAIPAPVASTRYYLYLDYSAITSGVEITANELVWSDTAPVYSHTYGGWYNGNDLCIFFAVTNSGNTDIFEFFHDGGDYVHYAQRIQAVLGLTPSITWTDVDLSNWIPSYCSKVCIVSLVGYIDTAGGAWAMAKTNGQASTSGHFIGTANNLVQSYGFVETIVITDSSQVIEVAWSLITAGNTISVYIKGWYFPVGM